MAESEGLHRMALRMAVELVMEKNTSLAASGCKLVPEVMACQEQVLEKRQAASKVQQMQEQATCHVLERQVAAKVPQVVVTLLQQVLATLATLRRRVPPASQVVATVGNQVSAMEVAFQVAATEEHQVVATVGHQVWATEVACQVRMARLPRLARLPGPEA